MKHEGADREGHVCHPSAVNICFDRAPGLSLRLTRGYVLETPRVRPAEFHAVCFGPLSISGSEGGFFSATGSTGSPL